MDWKTLGKKLLFPPIWVIIVLVILSTVALVTVFVKGWQFLPVSSVVYVLAFYSLTIFCGLCLQYIPRYYITMKGLIYRNKYANQYFTDAAFKTYVGLYGSLAINLIYVVVNAVSAILYGTYWFAIFAVYYAIMAVMRFLLVRYVSKNQIGKSPIGELRRSRLCAYILMTVNLAL